MFNGLSGNFLQFGCIRMGVFGRCLKDAVRANYLAAMWCFVLLTVPRFLWPNKT